MSKPDYTELYFELNKRYSEVKEDLTKAVNKTTSIEYDRDFYKSMVDKLDHNKRLQWYQMLNWLYKRELIGWIIAAVVSFSWFITWLLSYTEYLK